MKNAQVDVIITDYPAKAREVIYRDETVTMFPIVISPSITIKPPMIIRIIVRH